MDSTKKILSLTLVGLLCYSLIFSYPASAETNTYGIEFDRKSENGTIWYYNITYNKEGSDPPDISYFEIVFNCSFEEFNVYILEAGGDCIKDIEPDCNETAFPCNTTSIKWEFESDCIEANYGENGTREMNVWFSTFPYNYTGTGPLLDSTAKGGGGDKEVKYTVTGLVGPWCGSFFEIPELPFGTLTAIATPVLALLALGLSKRRK